MNPVTCDHQVVLARHWNQRVCGDHFQRQNTRSAATLILADGQGKGLQAHLWGRFFVQRLSLALDKGVSLRHAVRGLTAEDERHGEDPQTAFLVIRTLADGRTTLISRHMPPPLYWQQSHAPKALLQTPMPGYPSLGESSLILEPGDRLFCCSDGVPQACRSSKKPEGWGLEGLSTFLGNPNRGFPAAREVVAHLYRQSQGRLGDDTSCLDLRARIRRDLHLWLGPPPSLPGQAADAAFWNHPGKRVIIGMEAADAWARRLGVRPFLDPEKRYSLPGADMVLRRRELLDRCNESGGADAQMDLLRHWIREADIIGLHAGAPLGTADQEQITRLTRAWDLEEKTWWMKN